MKQGDDPMAYTPPQFATPEQIARNQQPPRKPARNDRIRWTENAALRDKKPTPDEMWERVLKEAQENA
jgi:hypothetical protein